MKGVNFVVNDKNERIAVQIDLKTLRKHGNEIEDLLYAIVTEHKVGNDQNSAAEYTENFKKELDRRNNAYKNGNEKTVRASKSKKRIESMLKPSKK